MKMLNKILFSIMLMFSLSTFAYADLTTNNKIWYSFDDSELSGSNPLDSSINGNDGTNFGAVTGATGILQEAFDFESGDPDYVDTPYTIPTDSDFSVNVWINPESSGNEHYYFTEQTSTTGRDGCIMGVLGSDDKIRALCYIGNSATAIIQGQGPVISSATWAMITITYDEGGQNMKYYYNSVLQFTDSSSDRDSADDTVLIGKQAHTGTRDWDGLLDEYAVYTKELTQTDVNELYNSGLAENPYFDPDVPGIEILNITADDVVLINNTFYNSNIIFESNLLNITTNGLINHSYSLNGTSFVQYGTDTLNASVDLNLTSGYYHISFLFDNNETTNSTQNYSFIVDRVAPSIEIVGNLTSDIFFMNFSNIVNVSDPLSGLASCTIQANYLENITNASQYDKSINCEDSTTFGAAGVYNGTFTATDNAGNVAILNENITIQPFVTVNIVSTNSSNITGYDALIIHPSGIVETFTNINNPLQISPFFNGSLDLGTYIINFSRLAFASESCNVTINETSGGNTLNFTVIESRIIIKIFDRQTNMLLTGLTEITIQATQGFNGSTVTGELNVSDINFVSEQYQILAEHVGYGTENVFFNYNTQENININIYMLNSTAPEEGQINIIVKNSLSQFVESAVCSALEWRASESAFVSVAQGLSNVVGETLLNIQLNTKIYKFSCTKGEFTTITNAQIVQIDTSNLIIILNDVILEPTTLFPNLVSSITNTTINTTHQLITYNFADADGLTTESCLNVYNVNGNRQNLNAQNCVSSSTGTLLLTININQTSDLLIQGTLTTPSVIDFVVESLTFKGNGNIANQFKIIGLDILIPTMFILLGLGLGILLSKIEIGVVFIAIAAWVSVAFVPTILKSSIAMFITVVVAMMLWGGFNRK